MTHTTDWAGRGRRALDRRLSRELQLVGFPITLEDAYNNPALRDPELTEWAREAILQDRVRYSSQLEMLARGHSLIDIAWTCLGRERGSPQSLRETLHQLSRWPDEPLPDD